MMRGNGWSSFPEDAPGFQILPNLPLCSRTRQGKKKSINGRSCWLIERTSEVAVPNTQADLLHTANDCVSTVSVYCSSMGGTHAHTHTALQWPQDTNVDTYAAALAHKRLPLNGLAPPRRTELAGGWFDDSPHLAAAAGFLRERTKKNKTKTGKPFSNTDTNHQVRRLLVCGTPVLLHCPPPAKKKKHQSHQLWAPHICGQVRTTLVQAVISRAGCRPLREKLEE